MQNSNSTSSGFFSTVTTLLFRKWVIMGVIGFGLVIIFLLFSDAWFGGGTKLSKIYLQYVERADRALMNDSLETALQLYFKALDIDDRQTTLYGKIAEGYFFAAMRHKQEKNKNMNEQMLSQAIGFLNQGLEKDPDNPYFNYIAGLIAMDRNQNDSAIAKMSLAYSQGVRAFNLHLYLSDLYNEKEETALCLEHLEKANEIKPNDQRVLFNLGEIYFRTGNFSNAVKYHARLVEVAPEIIDYKAIYAASLWKNGDEKTAKNIFNQILHDQTVNDLQRHHVVAWTLIDRNVDYEWGIKVANVTAETKRDITSFDILGWGYYNIGDYKKAVYYLSLSYNQQPTAEVKRRLEMAQEKLKNSGK
jgi:tetratricopeptide (TPR) repeat protein